MTSSKKYTSSGKSTFHYTTGLLLGFFYMENHKTIFYPLHSLSQKMAWVYINPAGISPISHVLILNKYLPAFLFSKVINNACYVLTIMPRN
jgi:hypothetical protein